MDISLNNLDNPSNIVCLSDVPNILKVEDFEGGTYASFLLQFNPGLKPLTSRDGQWYITILGETITNVIDQKMAVGKNFYIADTTTSLAASVARALRCCPTIAANFNVTSNGSSVTVKAKEVGPLDNNSAVSTNITYSYLTVSRNVGSANAELYGSKVVVDLFTEKPEGQTYVTTLEKNYYNTDASFNLSPVLTTLTTPGKVAEFDLKISKLKNGEYTTIGNINNNYVTIGYMVNQGDKYINANDFNYAQNFKRGEEREFANNSLLYIYSPTLPISFYNGNDGRFYVTVDYVDSAGNILETFNAMTWSNTDSSKKLWDITLNLASNTGLSERFKQAFYIDVHLGTHTPIRYNVIKPLKATEYYQRIYWRNSYGGISFFDFTGQKSETRDLNVSTYQKNIFGYYDDTKNELEKIYNNDVKYTVSLKSHLFENDGKYIFNDMMQSTEAWVERNGETYGIIIDSVSVEETNQNNIYEASVKYHYSQEPSLI